MFWSRWEALLNVLILVHSCTSLAINRTGRLIQNDWDNLRVETTIRLFSDKYYEGGDADAIWEDMGDDIDCIVHDDLTTEVFPPPNFDSSKPIKLLTHGFSSSAQGGKTNYVNGWMKAYNNDVNVILLDWSGLAFFIQAPDWDSYLYDSAARNGIDVGEYLGHCLAALNNLGSSNFHLAGHSLGAHLVGKAGRVYKEITGQSIQRISGLDPAGPRFVDGPIMSAIPELHENRLNTESASYVDVIHTCASLTPAAVWISPRLGDLHQLGHADFYPGGGSAQNGCELFGPDALPAGICSHKRAPYYFLHSILEPTLFPSRECSDVDSCANFETISDDVASYMGEISQDYMSSNERKLYFLDISDNHWTYYEHGQQYY